MAGQEHQTGELIQVFKKVGRLIAESMGIGIKDGTHETTEAMDRLNQELLESQQRYIEEKIKNDQALETAEAEKASRESYIRLQSAREAKLEEISRQKERLLLQKQYNQEYVEALQAHLVTVKDRVKLEKNKIAEAFNEIAKSATQSLEEFDRAREKMANKMVNFAGLFQSKREIFLNSGPRGTKEIFEHTLLDLSQERAELERYTELLRQIRRQKDIPNELFQVIRDLPIQDALLYQEALLGLGDEERKAYIADWVAIGELANQTSFENYADDTKRALQTIEEELKAWYGTIPSGFFNEGVLAAEAFGTAFINKMYDLQETLQSAVSSAMAGMTVQAAAVGGAAGGVVQHRNYTTNYVLNSAGETVSQQLRSARNHAVVAQMREG